MGHRTTRKSRRRESPRATAPTKPGPSAAWVLQCVLAFVALGYGVLGRIRYFDWCIHDDAYISFRYARNLVRGDGLVMNPGERVEGITNFLWTVIVAPALAWGADPARFTQALGAVISIALMLAAFVWTARRMGGSWYGLFTPAILAFNIAYLMESLSGLETLAFTGLVFAIWVAYLEERRDGERRPGLWAALAAVATLVRPEGALVFAVLAAWSVLGILRGEPWARLRTALIVYVLLVLPLVVFRWAYYGSPLPNTFYAKVGSTLAQVERGWRYARVSFLFSLGGPLIGVAVLGTLVTLARPRTAPGVPPPRAPWTRLLDGRPRDEALATGLVLTLVYAVYIVVVGGDYEPTARFFMPVLPLVYLLFQEALRTAVLQFDRPRTRVVAGFAALVVAALCFAQSEQRYLQVLQSRGWPNVRRDQHEQCRLVGEWLHANTQPGTRIALASIGAIPYYADRPILDMMGLTDRHIGRRRIAGMGQGPAGHEKGDGAYVLEARPDIILIDKGTLFPEERSRDEVLAQARGTSEIEIARSEEFARDYELRRAPTAAGVLHYFVRVR